MIEVKAIERARVMSHIHQSMIQQTL